MLFFVLPFLRYCFVLVSNFFKTLRILDFFFLTTLFGLLHSFIFPISPYPCVRSSRDYVIP